MEFIKCQECGHDVVLKESTRCSSYYTNLQEGRLIKDCAESYEHEEEFVESEELVCSFRPASHKTGYFLAEGKILKEIK